LSYLSTISSKSRGNGFGSMLGTGKSSYHFGITILELWATQVRGFTVLSVRPSS
jgi:hypothetical protein